MSTENTHSFKCRFIPITSVLNRNELLNLTKHTFSGEWEFDFNFEGYSQIEHELWKLRTTFGAHVVEVDYDVIIFQDNNCYIVVKLWDIDCNTYLTFPGNILRNCREDMNKHPDHDTKKTKLDAWASLGNATPKIKKENNTLAGVKSRLIITFIIFVIALIFVFLRG